jgi:predicted dehydrogenase
VDNIRLALIGVGHLGKNHARVFSELKGVTLVAVVDIKLSQAQEIANLYQTKPCTDYKQILNEVDAVSIVTPTVAHYQIARDIISAGIHTFIEKPITTTISEADKLVSLAKKNKVVLQVGHIERFNPAFVASKDYIRNPRFIECHRLSPFSFRSIDIDVVLDLMIHDIDIILSIVKSTIKRIDAVGVKIISDKVDLANVRLLFANRCVANLTASRSSDKAMRKMRIFTDKNYVSLNFADKTASVYQRKGNLTTLRQRPKPGFNPREFMLDKFIKVRFLSIPSYDQLEKELESFIETIRENKTPEVSGTDARDALATCYKILGKL